MFCVAVDDGHGMKTAGKRTPLFPDGSYMPENAYNRAVASYLMDALKDAVFVSLQWRRGMRTHLCRPASNGQMTQKQMRISVSMPMPLAVIGMTQMA